MSRLTPLLSRWLDGRATPDEERSALRLLASDPEAAAEVARLRRAADVLRRESRSDPAPGLADRVLAAGAVGAGEMAAARRLARRYVAAAAVLLGLGVGGSLWLARGAEAQPPREALAGERLQAIVLHALESALDESDPWETGR
jgi:anti-sigma factor RsiW